MIAIQRCLAKHGTTGANQHCIRMLSAGHRADGEDRTKPRAATSQSRAANAIASWKHFAMAHQHLLLAGKTARQSLDKIYRPMLATGAADRYGQITTVILDEAGQPTQQVAFDIGIHCLHVRLGCKEIDYRPILAGQRPSWYRNRVGQTADIEHQIGIQRYAVKPND